MKSCQALILFSALGLLHSCEKVELNPNTDGDNAVEIVVPTSLGQGTQLSPYTVAQVISGDAPSGSTSWVCGYIVGSTYRTMSNAVFDANTTYSGNILISDDSLCADKSKCIAVELTTKVMQQSLSLAENPQHYRQCVIVNGLLGRYFSQPGIRSAKAGYYLDGFDISNINTSPEEWNEKEIRY